MITCHPPLCERGATLAERSAEHIAEVHGDQEACPFPDFLGDQMDARSWLHMMAGCSRVGARSVSTIAVMVAFCDWRQMPLLTDAVQWAGWQWRGTLVWDKLISRPQKDGFGSRQVAVWASNGKLPIDRPVSVLPGGV